MDEAEVAAVIEERLPDAEATVETPRDPDDDRHYAIEVTSPVFAGETLVDQHQLVHDALSEYLQEEIHAIEVRTHVPDE